jgi:hypothetical protein
MGLMQTGMAYMCGSSYRYAQARLACYLTNSRHTIVPPVQVCLSTVGVLGDLCRNVEDGILPYCDEIMSILITNLGREDVHRTIKPQVSRGICMRWISGVWVLACVLALGRA